MEVWLDLSICLSTTSLVVGLVWGDLSTTFWLRVGLFSVLEEVGLLAVLEEVELGLLSSSVWEEVGLGRAPHYSGWGVPCKSFWIPHCLGFGNFLGIFVPLDCSIVVRGGGTEVSLYIRESGALMYWFSGWRVFEDLLFSGEQCSYDSSGITTQCQLTLLHV